MLNAPAPAPRLTYYYLFLRYSNAGGVPANGEGYEDAPGQAKNANTPRPGTGQSTGRRHTPCIRRQKLPTE
jgi:hypothetical protein